MRGVAHHRNGIAPVRTLLSPLPTERREHAALRWVLRHCPFPHLIVMDRRPMPTTKQLRHDDYRKLLEQLPDVVFSLDLDGRFTYLNPRAEEFFDQSVDELCGTRFWDHTISEDAVEARSLIEGPRREIWDREITFRCVRGDTKYARIRCMPCFDQEGRLVGYQGILRDRTVQRRLEQQLKTYQESLQESEFRYRCLVEEVPDVIFSLDGAGKFMFLNAQAEALFGRPVSQILGTLLWDHVASEDRAVAESILRVEFGAVWDEEMAMLDAEGRQKWVRIRCRPLEDPVTGTFGYEGVIRDRTLRRKLEEELKTSQQELLKKIKIIDNLYEHLIQSEKSKAIAEHTAEVAHELRQPLAIIGGFARRMASKLETCQKLDPDSQKECFGIIIREVQRLERILGGLIEFNRQEEIKLQYVDPNDLIEEVLQIYEERMGDKDLDLRLDLGDEVGEISLDPERFQLVLRNLMANAIEASPRGGQISIETRMFVPGPRAQQTGGLDAESYLELKISNQGDPIPPEALRKIFDPFYTTKRYGIGIGLTLCKRIVEEHRGSISVKSGEHWTVFTVWVPSQQRPVHAAFAAESNRASSEAAGKP